MFFSLFYYFKTMINVRQCNGHLGSNDSNEMCHWLGYNKRQRGEVSKIIWEIID